MLTGFNYIKYIILNVLTYIFNDLGELLLYFLKKMAAVSASTSTKYNYDVGMSKFSPNLNINNNPSPKWVIKG